MCAYKPPRPKTTGGPSGLADIKFNGDKTKVKVTLDANGDSVVLSKGNCPDELSISGKYMVRLSADKTKMLSCYPAVGIYPVKFVEFAHRQDEPPAPVSKHSEYGDYLQFTALLTITDGKFKGMIIPQFLRYVFKPVEDDDGEEVVGIPDGGPKAIHAPKLAEFSDAFGVWKKGRMKWQDNLLPGLQKRILDAATNPSVVMKEGYVQNIVGQGWEETGEEPEPSEANTDATQTDNGFDDEAEDKENKENSGEFDFGE